MMLRGDMIDQGDFHRFFDAVPGPFCLITADAEERIAFASKEVLDIYQCADENAFAELTGGRFRGMVDEAAPASLAERVEHAGAGGADYCYLSFSLRGARGHYVQVEGSAKRANFDGRPYWSLVFADMRLRTVGIEGDDVTGLMGMHEFYEQSGAVAEDDQEKGVYGTRYPIYFNIANFKAYNRLHGIEAGDACLRRAAHELESRFPHAMIAHLAADSFVVLEPAGDDGVFKRIEGACAAIDAFIDNPRIRTKAGVFVADTPAFKNVPSSDTVDYAKIACDSIKRDVDTCWAVYTEEMGRRIEVRARVLEHFEDALKDGSIKVFAQPFVRTFSGKVCGAELLARWDTQTGERLRPDEFIPVLEEARLIHKLDLNVIDFAVRMLRSTMDSGHEIVPMSINISRADFALIDVFEEVDRAARMFEIPREYLRIEVTETVIAEHDAAVRDTLARFRANGYQVWIDDFGSGVSSLNVLKDYDVDALKIDMLFLRNFNEKSRAIVTSIVRMAKELGIHTIAEGVETQDQADFLTSIGCEVIQGYLCGKPAIATAVTARCRRMGLEPESPFERQMYARAGLVNLVTDVPVAVASFRGGDLSILCANDAYLGVIREIGYPGREELNSVLSMREYPIREKFEAHLLKARASGKREMMTFVERGNYLRIFVERVGAVGDVDIFRFELYNITHDEDRESVRHFDQMLRSIVPTYDAIYCLHVASDELEIVETADAGVKPGQRIAGIEAALAELGRKNVHEDDLPRYLSFMRIDNLYRQARESKRLDAANFFRVRRADGTYRWMVFDAIVLSHEEKADIILCSHDDVMEKRPDLVTLLPAFAASWGFPLAEARVEVDLSWSLWRAVVDFAPIPLFWKDRDLRYRGVNRAFLDKFRLASLDDVMGRTDGELGFYVDASTHEEVERAVLKDGEPARAYLASCVVDGQMRRASLSAIPVYRDGRVVGIEGGLRLLDEIEELTVDDRSALLANSESGLPGYRSFMMAGIEFADSYRRSGESYLLALIDVPEFNSTCASYDSAFRRHAFTAVWNVVNDISRQGGVLAHMGSCSFAYLEKSEDVHGLRSRLFDAAARVHAITEVDGCPCTLYLQVAVGASTEARSFEGLMRLVGDRLGEAEEQSYGREMFTGDRILLARTAFDNLEDPVALWERDSYKVVYLNRAFLHDLHLPENYSYAGQPCYKLIEGYDEPCAFCRRGILQYDQFDSRTHHNRLTGKDYFARDVLVPWQGKECVLHISLNLSSYMERDRERNDFIFREAAANDAIAAGMQEVDPSEGVRKFMDHVGRSLEAERFFVFEEAGDGTVNATFEWKRDADAPDLLPELARIPLSEVRALLDEFDRTPVTLIEDVDAFRGAHPGFVVHVDGAKSIVSGFLSLSNGRSGYSLVVNPSPETFHTASLLLTTLTRFLEVMLRNRDIVAHLKELGTTDQLTGVMNRRALIEHLDALPAGRDIAVIFGDVNGLKKVNDEQGHRAGDELIASVAQVMSGIVGRDKVFRMGGDEFLMIVENAAGRDIDAIMRELRRGFARHGASVALGSASYTTPIANVDAVISKVDRLMYADKGAHYFGRRTTDN